MAVRPGPSPVTRTDSYATTRRTRSLPQATHTRSRACTSGDPHLVHPPTHRGSGVATYRAFQCLQSPHTAHAVASLPSAGRRPGNSCGIRRGRPCRVRRGPQPRPKTRPSLTPSAGLPPVRGARSPGSGNPAPCRRSGSLGGLRPAPGPRRRRRPAWRRGGSGGIGQDRDPAAPRPPGPGRLRLEGVLPRRQGGPGDPGPLPRRHGGRGRGAREDPGLPRSPLRRLAGG